MDDLTTKSAFDNTIIESFSQPTIEEIENRFNRLWENMDENSLDYYVCVSTDNIFYLTNFANYVHERPFILIISQNKNDNPTFLVPKLEMLHVAMRKIGQIEIVSYAEFPAPSGEAWIDRFQQLIPSTARVGIESICPRFVVDAIVGDVICTDLIDDLRMVKSTYELSRIQYASNLASKAHGHFLETVHVGDTMLQAGQAVTGEIMTRLLSDEPSLNIFATKVNHVFQPPSISHDPHNFTDINMVVENGGPHVTIINGVMNGYGTEIERTFFMGYAPEAAKRPFETMMLARRSVMEMALPGTSMNDVDKAVNEIFRRAGYEDYLLHRAGHGIGVTGHEAPFFAEGYHRVLVPDMVFTVEPGIYISGVGGFRHSDTIRITDSVAVSMTVALDDIDDLIITT